MVNAQCSKEELAFDFDSTVLPETHQLPVGKGKLKVLAIGNSFVDDPMAYFNDIVLASGIDRNNLCVYSAVVYSSSLKYWGDNLADGENVTINRCAGLIDMPVTQAPLREILKQDWDVVTVQQLSNLSQDAKTLSKHLPYIVSQIRELCPNKDVVIAWQMVWSDWYDGYSYEYSKKSWEKITEVVKTTPYYGIDMIIPTGTAIQNARSTNLNSPHGLTRDGKHLGFGVGLYVAACTWFEALIAPVFGVSVLGNTSTHEITEWERSHSKFETSAVTNQNRTLCQQCAVTAVATPYVTSQ